MRIGKVGGEVAVRNPAHERATRFRVRASAPSLRDTVGGLSRVGRPITK